MIVYRVCSEEEIKKILEEHDFSKIGNKFSTLYIPKMNNHKYEPNQLYLHFFKDKGSILYLENLKKNYLCSYDIPNEILDKNSGIGYYWDLLNYSTLCNVPEYAIKSDEIIFDYLKEIDYINKEIDIEDYLEKQELTNFLKLKYKKRTISSINAILKYK